MKDELIKLLDKAYAPYSKFHVAAIIEMNDGKYIPGVNVENASYGATICAERNAIFSAVANGCKKIKKIVLVATAGKNTGPCGACRTVIDEFADGDIPVIFGENPEHLIVTTSKTLYSNDFANH
jgi:cytidine deaminase